MKSSRNFPSLFAEYKKQRITSFSFVLETLPGGSWKLCFVRKKFNLQKLREGFQNIDDASKYHNFQNLPRKWYKIAKYPAAFDKTFKKLSNNLM